MSFAGIVYETETHDARQLEQKIEPIAKFFGNAEQRVGDLAVPASLIEGARAISRSNGSLSQSQR